MTTIVGIDPSLSNTGIVSCDPAMPGGYALMQFKSKALGDGVHQRIERMARLVAQVAEYVETMTPVAVFIETYSLGSRNNVALLGEFGGILRFHLTDIGACYEVAPTTLKKFATGKGNTKGKDLMAAHITQRWGVLLDSSDAYDAFALWKLGRCALGIDQCDNQAQREAVAKVLEHRPPEVIDPASCF